MNSSLKSVPASDAQLFTDNVCKDEADANRAVRGSSLIDTSVNEDCNLHTEDTTQVNGIPISLWSKNSKIYILGLV